MYILGAVTSGHDSSACLLKNGKIKNAISDKRLSRIKYRFENNSIRKSIEYILASEGIKMSDIELICCDTDHVYPQDKPPQDIFPDFLDKNKVIQLNHHLGHACSTFFPSPFEEAAIITVDACGGIAPIVTNKSSWGMTQNDIDFQNRGFIPYHRYKPIEQYIPQSESITLIRAKRGEKLKELDNQYVDSSLGFFYGHMSHYLYMEEGELMGLAGYGKPSAYYDEMKKVIELLPEGKVKLNPEYIKCWQGESTLNPPVDLSYLQPKFYESFGSKRKLHEEINQRFMDFAYAAQKRLEDAMIHIANHLYSLTECPNLCIAGGVGLNSIANHKILQETPFKNIWIQPAATDDGIAIGNALFGYYVLNNMPKEKFIQMPHAYTGKTYDNKEIENLLSNYKNQKRLEIEYLKDNYQIQKVQLFWKTKEESQFKSNEMTYYHQERKYKISIPILGTSSIDYYFETS